MAGGAHELDRWLAALYRETGRLGDAEAVGQELRQLLAVADPDHPIGRQLRLQ